MTTFSLYLTHTALQVAVLFMNIFKLHGLPQSIVSDRDKIFTSNLWKELFKLLGTNLHMSSAYHLQSDGQSERVNQCVETYLRCFVHSCPAKWSSWLALAEFWYNTSFHSSLGNTPFFVLYGHHPQQLGIEAPCSSENTELNSWLQDRDLTQQLVQQHLLRAQRKMKLQADKKLSFRSFQIGDSVYVKIQPYVQTSLANRSSNKLSFRFFGPFKIVTKINEVAYQLWLPEDCLIHPVFHVSQLKQAVSPNTMVSQELPDPSFHFQVPQQILDRRLHLHNNATVPQVLVKWSHLPLDLSTWEDEEALRQEFPRAPAWGQAISRGGGDVTNTRVLGASTEPNDDAGPNEAAEPEHTEEEKKSDEGNEGIQRQGWNRRPNPQVYGPDWV